MGWFTRRMRTASRDLYEATPLAASRGLARPAGAPAPEAPTRETLDDAQRLRRWAHGITLTTALATTGAFIIRGWTDGVARHVIISVSVAAFLWAYSLTRASHNRFFLRHVPEMLWVNSVILLLLVTGIVAMTGASLSPLYWMFLVLIVVEALQDRQRGTVVSWLAWGSFCGMILAQAFQWLPDEHTGVSPEARLLGNTRIFHAVGAAAWYAVIAAGVTVWARWSRHLERELAQQRQAHAAQEQAIVAERERVRTDHASVGERSFELDQAKRRLEAERVKFEHERKQWEFTRAEESQHAADDKAALQSQLHVGEEQRAKLARLQQQFDEAQRIWDEQRTGTLKMLDDREVALGQRAKVLEAAQEGFEAQRAKTTQSLGQLEQTLLSSYKHIGEEMAQVESQRRAIEDAEAALARDRAAWEAQRGQAPSAGMAEASAPLEEARRALDAEQAAFRRERETLEAAIADQQARLAAREQELNGVRAAQAQEAAALQERAAALEAMRAELERVQLAYTKSADEVEAQRQRWAQEQRAAIEQLAQRDAQITDRAAQVAAQAKELARARADALDERTQLTERQQTLAQASTALEQERAAAMKAASTSRSAQTQRARQLLHEQAKKLREQAHELATQERGLKEREAKLAKSDEAIQRTHDDIAAARRAFEDERAHQQAEHRMRGEELAAQQRDLELSRRQLREEHAQLERTRHESDTAQATHAQEAAARRETQEQELAGLRQELAQLERMLSEQHHAHELNTQEWQATVRRAEATAAARTEELSAQRQTIEQQARELAAQHQLLEAARQQQGDAHSAQDGALAAARTQLDDARRALEAQQRQFTQSSLEREQELAARLEQLTALQRDVEDERAKLQPQRSDVAIAREQLTQEREQLTTMQRQLNEARRQLAEASMQQGPEPLSTEALTLLANEFNAPLASLNALLETLIAGDHGEVHPPLAQALGDIKTTHDRLRRVVSDALDAARLDQGQLPMHVQPIPVRELLAAELPLAQRLGESKGVRVTAEAPETLAVAADPEQARRILRILLQNAVQYTSRGTVTVSCTDDRERVILTVTDTGVGLQPTQLSQLFAKPKLGSLVRGKGLSLSLARSLAKAMHGELTLVSSELENGSSFALILPKPMHAAAAPRAEGAAAKVVA